MKKILRSREITITPSPPSKPRKSPPPPSTPPNSLDPPKKPSPSSSITNPRRSSRLSGKSDQYEQTPGIDLSSGIDFDNKDTIFKSKTVKNRIFNSDMAPRRSTRLSEWKNLTRCDLGFDELKRKNVDFNEGPSISKKVKVLDEHGVGHDNVETKSDDKDGMDGMVGLLVPQIGGSSSSRRRSARLNVTIESGEDVKVDDGNDNDKSSSSDDDDEVFYLGGRIRYSREEKGKGIAEDLNLKPEEQEPVKEMDVDPVRDVLMNGVDPDFREFIEAVDEESLMRENIKAGARTRVRSRARRREQFHDIARRSAFQFAHSRAEEEEENVGNVTAEGGDGALEVEDWPGPFSTAMKIIRDRAAKQNAPQTAIFQGRSSNAPAIDWTPSRDQTQMRKKSVPALRDLCLDILYKNSEQISSLDFVPNDLREKLTQKLCDSRKMGSYFMDLLVAGTPEMVRVKDCSWMSEEQMTKTFKECDKSEWSVLQLDLCGRCLPDVVLRETLAQSPKHLPKLVAISLKGACRITDAGLSSLLAAAPTLRSVNLAQCSLITSTSIGTLADSLGSLLRELYLDYCQGIDAMLMLPALKKLKCLEVFSVADMQSVSDDFVSQFVTECGQNIKELGLATCENLTDVSMKAIAENCPGLCALDLSNLRKLTDLSIGHIANGCSTLQRLQLSRNAFTDEAIAAFFESSGGSLIELSLNSVKKVGPHTAISLVRCCSKNLQSLDLSFCRNLTDVAVGYIVDGCLSLKKLKLFGCTQLTNVFVNGYCNELVKIIGLKMSPILEHLDKINVQEGLLRYSSVEAC